MSGGNKKKMNSTVGGSISNATPTPTTPTSAKASGINLILPGGNTTFNLPIGDPFERILTTPKGSLIQRAASPRRSTASPLKSRGNPSEIVCLEHLPRLNETNLALREKLLESKLDQCSVLCQFEPINLDGPSAYTSTDALTNGTSTKSPATTANFISPLELRNREIKRQTLMELIELINGGNKAIPDELYPKFFQMIFRNLFRPVPPPLNPTGDAFDPAEDEPVLEPSWPHLQLIYELFIRFLESPDLNGSLAKKYIDSTFIQQLLSLFDVEDPRERDLLKTTLHRIYAKFLQLRSFIRKSIHNVFYEFIAEPTEYRHNISEMLEILGSIINGFALPLKDEHKIFLEKTLLPLHKTRYLSLYFRQLDYCLIQFVEKDPSLSVSVILGLLRIWPKTNSTKELMFLTEIEEIMEIISIENFGQICNPLFRQLAKCIDSNHFQVAERALMLWHNENISTTLIPERFEEILRIVLPVLSKHSKNHWNRNVQILILNALECFMTIDPIVFDSCVASLPEIEKESLNRKEKLFNCWRELDKKVDCCVDDKLARDQLYSLLKDVNELESEPENITAETTISTTNTTAQSKTSSIVNARRKSILPIDTNVYQELVNYSRSSSPSPENESESEKEMRE